MENKFYLSKGGDMSVYLRFGYTWESGELKNAGVGNVGATGKIDVTGFARFAVETDYTYAESSILHFFNENEKIVNSIKKNACKRDDEIPSGVKFVAVEINFSKSYSGIDTEFEHKLFKEVSPHYKNISKHYTKESNQEFFRESIEGKVNLYGQDYLYVKNSSLDDILEFYIYRNGERYAVNEFSKTDCKYNHSKYSVELQLKPKDKYNKLLNGYKNTYDLLKMPIGHFGVELTKRCVIQMYLAGGNTISNYAGGTYWENEVTTPVSDAVSLTDKYYFTKGAEFAEIKLSGFNWDINGIYKSLTGESLWNNSNNFGSIVFTKVYSAGHYVTGNTFEGFNPLPAYKLSDATTVAYTQGGSQGGGAWRQYTYDTYRIEIYERKNGGGKKLYQSKALFGNDSDFVIKSGSNLYEMEGVELGSPYISQEPWSFFLGSKVITYSVWVRLLCDVSVGKDGKSTYALPFDDFASDGENYKRCIGLEVNQAGNNRVKLLQSANVSDTPTPYGINDEGKYFNAPKVNGENGQLFPYPLLRKSWGNTSLWVALEENDGSTSLPSIERLTSNFYKIIQHKDSFEIGSVIKALLSEIDSSIKFEATSEYSEFLYGSTVEDSIGAKGLAVVITQKSNVLNGEYDQAAQKAETTLEQIMELLKKGFRCYWYIDEKNRFRIEHVNYFLKGRSYYTPSLQYDLTAKYDKSNKHKVLYGQNEASFNKSDLSSRYEFAWANDSTEALGGGFSVDVVSNYVQKDKTESINIESFTPDIDLMMFSPSKFSQDGFALMVASKNDTHRVPIVYKQIYNQKNIEAPLRLYVQNYYASFIHLFNYYLNDMPAKTIISSVETGEEDKIYYVNGVKRCMKSNIQIQTTTEPDLYKLIRTELGDGSIEDMTIDIDKGTAQIQLSFEPK